MSKQPTATLARAFRDYISACRESNWLVRQTQLPVPLPPPSSPSSSSPHPQPSSSHRRDPEQPQPKLSTEEIHRLVGKGSNFHRNHVQEYLKSLAYPKLRRAQTVQRPEYPTTEARGKLRLSKALDTSKQQSTILHQLNSKDVDEIIDLLVELTPKPLTKDAPSPIQLTDQDFKVPSRKHIYTEIPPLPEFDDDPLVFERYVHTLTHSTFHFHQSSKFNGVVPRLLRNLFHPLNTRTSKLRTTTAYNHLIHFFSRKSDFATCRELLVQMHIEGVEPNTTTFNLMLKNTRRLRDMQHISSPYKIALKHLRRMKGYGIQADLVTWNTVFSLLSDEHSKIKLTQRRAQLNIPVDEHYIQSIVQYLIDTRDATSRELLEYIKELKLPMSGRPVRSVVHRLIEERQYDTALSVVRKFANGMAPSVCDLNAFLVRFARIKRVDLCVGCINTFREWRVRPDFDSYKLLMKSLSVSGHWKGKFRLLRVLYHQMVRDLDGVIAGEYWLRRLRSRLKFVYEIDVKLSPPLNDREIELQKRISQFKFTDSVMLWHTKNTEMKSLAELMGYYQSRDNAPRPDESEEMKLKKQKATRYRRKISQISIHKAMEKRVDYAEDQFAGLKKELYSRGIVEEDAI